jgi:cbb3-type cytochrome oxidase subunit 3
MSDELNLIGYRYNILLTVFFIFYLAYVIGSSYSPIS